MAKRNYEYPGTLGRGRYADMGELDDPSQYGDQEGYGRDPEAGNDLGRVGAEWVQDAALWSGAEQLGGVNNSLETLGDRHKPYEPSPEEAKRLGELGLSRFQETDSGASEDVTQ